MTSKIDWFESELGHELFSYQKDCIGELDTQRVVDNRQRLCLYYRTGAGKTLTSLICLSYLGHSDAIVIAPPTAHEAWVLAGKQLGIQVQPMSHAKFRMKSTLLPRMIPVVADEFHMFGGHGGQGWKKLDRLAGGLKAPMILASATPNYNDAERVYCIQHILDPYSCRGGFIQFLYTHCTTEPNHFGMLPIVTGFRNYDSAADYLAALPKVMYVPDDLVYQINDIVIEEKIPKEMAEYGYNARRHRMIASIIEERHAKIAHSLIHDDGEADVIAMEEVVGILTEATTPVLIYANHATVARAFYESLKRVGTEHIACVTGDASTKNKNQLLEEFKAGKFEVLVGTATLATGPDGLDKVCDTLIIVDDTEDDSLRRQLIGRIMPRGLDTDASKKQVHRLVLQ